MSVPRIFVDEVIQPHREIELADDRARYLGRVLRLGGGDAVTLFDGSGREFEAEIIVPGKNRVVVAVKAGADRNLESPLRIHLLQGISRGERMDVVVQKATELGVARITPLLTEYSVVKLDDKRAKKKLAHWLGVARSACEQCGRNVLPDIDEPMALRSWLGGNVDSTGTRVMLVPDATGSIRSTPPGDGELTVLVGPEGGFSGTEVELAGSVDFRPVGFGPRILRTETAALAILAGLQTLYGDLA